MQRKKKGMKCHLRPVYPLLCNVFDLNMRVFICVDKLINWQAEEILQVEINEKRVRRQVLFYLGKVFHAGERLIAPDLFLCITGTLKGSCICLHGLLYLPLALLFRSNKHVTPLFLVLQVNMCHH